MSSNAIKLIAAVLVAVTIVLLVVVFQMSRNYAQNASKATEQVQAAAAQTQVVVALKPLVANQTITKDEVALVPVQVAPQDYFTNVDDVVNRVPLIDVDAGSPVTPRYFKESNQLARLIPPGHKAVSLALSDVIGVGGFVRPGDMVDVLVYLRNDQSNKVDPAQARILLRDALVLASDDRIVAPPSGQNQNQQNQNQNPQVHHERTVVVAVPDEQVTRVMLGASLGDVRLALHPQAQTQLAGAPPQPPPALAPGPEADRPVTSAELAQLKVKHKAAGVVVYHGSTPSTVFP
jgi:pilus assembly protein CpaB